MTAQSSASQGNSKDVQPRNPFAGTGIQVIGIVRNFDSTQGKDGKLYHNLYLTTTANPDLKVGLSSPPDPNRFQVGSLAKITIRLHSWQKEGRSGMMLLEDSSL